MIPKKLGAHLPLALGTAHGFATSRIEVLSKDAKEFLLSMWPLFFFLPLRSCALRFLARRGGCDM